MIAVHVTEQSKGWVAWFGNRFVPLSLQRCRPSPLAAAGTQPAKMGGHAGGWQQGGSRTACIGLVRECSSVLGGGGPAVPHHSTHSKLRLPWLQQAVYCIDQMRAGAPTLCSRHDALLHAMLQ